MPENLPSPNNNASGSVVQELGLSGQHDFSMVGAERVIAVLAQKMDEMSQELHELKTEKILKETQLPPELLEQNGISLDAPARLKRGRCYRPVLAHEIIAAKEAVEKKYGDYNESMVARYMHIGYLTYRKYARRYNLWKPKPNVRGEMAIFDPDRGKYPLEEIVQGKHPNYPVFRIKDKLIRGKLKEPKCELCGFRERRVTDGKIPLILNFLDGNPKNHLLENMMLYCYNCTFIAGKGYIRRGDHFFDPDWLQDCEKDDAEKGTRW